MLTFGCLLLFCFVYICKSKKNGVFVPVFLFLCCCFLFVVTHVGCLSYNSIYDDRESELKINASGYARASQTQTLFVSSIPTPLTAHEKECVTSALFIVKRAFFGSQYFLSAYCGQK